MWYRPLNQRHDVGASALVALWHPPGSHRVDALIGAGGMGEVYRAHDTRLRRDVAIKMLPSAFAGDSDRVSRLEREARALAALKHPNIAAIASIEDTDIGPFSPGVRRSRAIRIAFACPWPVL